MSMSPHDFWDNIGGWFNAARMGRDHLHVKMRVGQIPECRRCGISTDKEGDRRG